MVASECKGENVPGVAIQGGMMKIHTFSTRIHPMPSFYGKGVSP